MRKYYCIRLYDFNGKEIEKGVRFLENYPYAEEVEGYVKVAKSALDLPVAFAKVDELMDFR